VRAIVHLPMFMLGGFAVKPDEVAMKSMRALITIGSFIVLLGMFPALAMDRSLAVSQHGHTAWTARDGFAVGAIFAMAQTPDRYLWASVLRGDSNGW
jgi:hypothetical protein